MMEVTKVPAKILAHKTKTVSLEDIKSGALAALVLDMKAAMKEREGVGFAANQIGKDLSIFVIEEALAKEYGVPEVYINPEITEYSKDTEEMEEGCLSIPQVYILIRRSKKVKLKAVSEAGEKLKLKARGLLARVFQHETDHLNGITIQERVQKSSRPKQ